MLVLRRRQWKKASIPFNWSVLCSSGRAAISRSLGGCFGRLSGGFVATRARAPGAFCTRIFVQNGPRGQGGTRFSQNPGTRFSQNPGTPLNEKTGTRLTEKTGTPLGGLGWYGGGGSRPTFRLGRGFPKHIYKEAGQRILPNPAGHASPNSDVGFFVGFLAVQARWDAYFPQEKAKPLKF